MCPVCLTLTFRRLSLCAGIRRASSASAQGRAACPRLAGRSSSSSTTSSELAVGSLRPAQGEVGDWTGGTAGRPCRRSPLQVSLASFCLGHSHTSRVSLRVVVNVHVFNVKFYSHRVLYSTARGISKQICSLHRELQASQDCVVWCGNSRVLISAFPSGLCLP